MKKRIFAFLMAILTIFTLSSCGKKNDEVTSNSDEVYLIKRDKNGFASVDDHGQLIIYETDEEGKIKKNDKGDEMTKSVSFPYYISNGEIVECSDFYLPIPDGWELLTGQMIKLSDPETKADISFTLRTTASIDECISQIKDLYDGWNVEWEEKTVTLEFAEAKCLSSSKIFNSHTKSYYIFTVNEKTYVINTSSNNQIDTEVDFVSIINTVCFRNK